MGSHCELHNIEGYGLFQVLHASCRHASAVDPSLINGHGRDETLSPGDFCYATFATYSCPNPVISATIGDRRRRLRIPKKILLGLSAEPLISHPIAVHIYLWRLENRFPT